MEEKKSFGEYIRRKRTDAGLTQKTLADRLFVTESSVSKWERGLSYPDVTIVPAVCRELGISEHEFFTACDDDRARKIERQAAVARGLSKGWQWFFGIGYAVAVVVCFICNIAIFHTLSWFWIVLASLALAFSFTNLPFLVEKNRTAICAGAATVSLTALLGACWLNYGGKWIIGGLCIVAACLALPWGIYALWRRQGRGLSVLVMALFSVWIFLLLAVVRAFTGGGWLFGVAYPITLVGLLFVWAAFAVLKWLPVNVWVKGGLLTVLAAFAVPVINSLSAYLTPAQSAPALSDYFAWWRIFAHQSAANFDWINILVFAAMLAAAVLLIAAGVVVQFRKRKSGQ